LVGTAPTLCRGFCRSQHFEPTAQRRCRGYHCAGSGRYKALYETRARTRYRRSRRPEGGVTEEFPSSSEAVSKLAAESGKQNDRGKGMSHEIRADYEQMDLMPQSMEDWVAGDHPARFIREFVDALDLRGLGFEERKSEEGRPSYANDLLLKVWLYGYLARIGSTRELERACREHQSLLWLTGRHAPDHNTLWRFWGENRKALRAVFRAGVKVAAAQGLVGLICHAVEGTKIRAVASRRTVEHRKDREKLLGRGEASIAKMATGVEGAEKTEV